MTSNLSSKCYMYHGGGYYYNLATWDAKWEGEEDAPPCRNITNVSVHPSVTSIGCEAFRGCRLLKSITLPPNLTLIDRGAFEGCRSLKTITLPSKLTSIGNTAFEGCALLTTVTLPPNLTSIGNAAFRGCALLTSITLPPTVKSVGWWVFSGCTSLRSVMGPVVSSSNNNNDSCCCHTLHSLLRTMTFYCDDFITLVIRLNPEQLKEVDADGNLPLQIAASLSSSTSFTTSCDKTLILAELLEAYPEAAKSPNKDGNLPLHILSSSHRSKGSNVQDFAVLLAAYPDAAKVSNHHGKLPLCLALEHQTQWNDGVEQLVTAFPAGTIQVDAETKLFPFMTAASKEAGSCLDSVYSLLINCPDMNMFYHANNTQDDC